MRILTYSDPFKLKDNSNLWKLITETPHFCASDTLVQGLETEYDRCSFSHLRTIDSLINRLFGDFTNNQALDIQLFLEVSSLIRSMNENHYKKSFRFNIADVVESIKLLIIMDTNVIKFKSELSYEQKVLLEIYEKIKLSSYFNSYLKLFSITREEFNIAALNTINDEILYYFSNKDYASKIIIPKQLNTPREGFRLLNNIIYFLENKCQEPPDNPFDGGQWYINDLKRAKHILSIMKSGEQFNKIIIHGVHKITPYMYFMFKLLAKIDVEILFLINYAPNLPNTYRTWKEVYSWCDAKFEFLEDLNLDSGNKLGKAISGIIEGKKILVKPDETIIRYRNLTSFTDKEVAETYKATIPKGEDIGNLNKMHTQYYAVRGESSNDLLRVYFPNQFEDKHFLSYPIGQFILGIYSMWDFENNTMVIDYRCLNECAVSNLFKSDENVFEILNKTKLYFSDIENVNHYYNRIEQLKTANKIVNSNHKFSSLKKLSFFSITLFQIEILLKFIKFIEDISNKLFKDSDKNVSFTKHFKTLMEILSNPASQENTLSETEKALIKELHEKLNTSADLNQGNIEDVKDAIAYYLAGTKKSDTSKWIVRDFEQIDGAVLLRKTTKAKHYHFALLSNEHMTNQNDDTLSWPLTNEMFNGYTDIESAIPIITKGLLERRNFLKYILFYGSFFTKCDIQLSFIEDENGEEQSPYYILRVLGLKDILFEEMVRRSFIIEDEEKNLDDTFNPQELSINAKEIFSICPYKFTINKLLKSEIIYYNEYHIKYYVSNYMYFYLKKNYDISSSDIINKADIEFINIRKLFPFWNDAVLTDIKSNTLNQIKGYDKKKDWNEDEYEWKKENFLIAQWKDIKTDHSYMNFKKQDVNKLICDYMKSNKLYPQSNNLPHYKVCENCNFSDICLRNYYLAHLDEVEEI